MPFVMQEWTSSLTFMQQSVLLTSLRGPDGIHKNHVSKKLIRWLRRCVLISAFDKKVLSLPYDESVRQGGSFTGPSLEAGDASWSFAMHRVLKDYMLTLDEVPHHFQLHFLHAAEILGYFHPKEEIKLWWNQAYRRLCNDMHLEPEPLEKLHTRLGDSETSWRSAEER